MMRVIVRVVMCVTGMVLWPLAFVAGHYAYHGTAALLGVDPVWTADTNLSMLRFAAMSAGLVVTLAFTAAACYMCGCVLASIFGQEPTATRQAEYTTLQWVVLTNPKREGTPPEDMRQ